MGLECVTEVSIFVDSELALLVKTAILVGVGSSQGHGFEPRQGQCFSVASAIYLFRKEEQPIQLTSTNPKTFFATVSLAKLNFTQDIKP